MRRRTRARELALKLLYKLDLLGEEPTKENVSCLAAEVREPSIVEFATDLVTNCCKHRKDLDRVIAGVVRNWDIRRMAIIDRNIMRIAVYELLYRQDIPEKVAINEAIDLAKKYSTADSGAFVNGILDKIREGKHAQKG